MTAPVIRGVNHIGITVPDIEAAKSFLVEAFGGQVIYQSFGPQDPARQGPEFERATGAYPGTVVRAQAMVKIGTGPDIELFEMHGPEKGPGNRVCYCRAPWGTMIEFITTPDRMAYHDQTDLRRWQDEE